MLKEADAGGGGVTGNAASATQSINVKDGSTRSAEFGGKRVALRLKTVLEKEMLWTGMKTMK